MEQKKKKKKNLKSVHIWQQATHDAWDLRTWNARSIVKGIAVHKVEERGIKYVDIFSSEEWAAQTKLSLNAPSLSMNEASVQRREYDMDLVTISRPYGEPFWEACEPQKHICGVYVTYILNSHTLLNDVQHIIVLIICMLFTQTCL